MDRDEFREALLSVMERKRHWAWPLFTSGAVAKDKLHIHLEQEYAVYIRDFAVLLGRAYVQCPVAAVRRDLAENLYEEETGRIIGLLQKFGFELTHPLMEVEDPGSAILRGLEEFREHLGGRLTIMLLTSIGEGTEVHEIDTGILKLSGQKLKTY